MSIARKILSNTFAQLLGKVLMAILGLAVVKIATNYLSLSEYGQYTIIYEFLAFFGISADLGLYTIAVREMSTNEKNTPKIIGNILSLRTILVTATMLVAVFLAFFIPKYEGTLIPIGIAIASITVFLTIINGTITSVLQARLQMHYASLATVFGKIISVAFMAYIVFFGFPENNQTGFYMLIFAGNIGLLANTLGTYYYVRKITPLKYEFDFQFWKRVLAQSIPYGIALILNTIYFRIDSLLIYFIRSASEVSIYGVAMKMLEQFTILPLYFMNSVLPVLSKAIKEKNEKYKEIIKYSFDFLTALSIPMVVGGVLLAYPMIFVVSSPEFLSRVSEGFYGSDIAFQILIFAVLFQFINVLFAFILISVDKQKLLLYINGACVLFAVITKLIVIPHFGFRGAAVTSVLNELFILIGTYFAAKKYLDFSLNPKNIFKIILSALIMGAVIFLLQKPTYELMQNWNIVPLILIGMLVYAAMLFATKTVDKNMLAMLRKGESTEEKAV